MPPMTPETHRSPTRPVGSPCHPLSVGEAGRRLSEVFTVTKRVFGPWRATPEPEYNSSMEWPCPTWACRGSVFSENLPRHDDVARCERAPGTQGRICAREMRWHEARQRWEPFGDIGFDSPRIGTR